MTTRLHLGCGRTRLEGWVNVDAMPLPSVDVVADLDACASTPLPFADDSVSEILMSHVIEHLLHPLPLMQELWRVAVPGAIATIHTPYGSSDDAWEDPTHVRPYFLQSFGYFSQPYYWRADYGYRGDWQAERITLIVDRTLHGDAGLDEILRRVRHDRNQVQEMVAELRAVKPSRSTERALQVQPQLVVQWASPS